MGLLQLPSPGLSSELHAWLLDPGEAGKDSVRESLGDCCLSASTMTKLREGKVAPSSCLSYSLSWPAHTD